MWRRWTRQRRGKLWLVLLNKKLWWKLTYILLLHQGGKPTGSQCWGPCQEVEAWTVWCSCSCRHAGQRSNFWRSCEKVYCSLIVISHAFAVDVSYYRYLKRRPMTTTDLLKKFRSKKTGIQNAQLVISQYLSFLDQEHNIGFHCSLVFHFYHRSSFLLTSWRRSIHTSTRLA